MHIFFKFYDTYWRFKGPLIKSERIKINIRVSVSDEIARCLGLGRQVVPDLYQT
jgi:hypothetical protein